MQLLRYFDPKLRKI
jgi:RNA recognition motif-containing protein